jgi:hypothetical protein
MIEMAMAFEQSVDVNGAAFELHIEGLWTEMLNKNSSLLDC